MSKSALHELEINVEKHRLVEINIPEAKAIYLAKRALKLLHKKDRPVYVGHIALELSLSLERTEGVIGILIDAGLVYLATATHKEVIGGRETDSVVILSEKSSPTIANSFF